MRRTVIISAAMCVMFLAGVVYAQEAAVTAPEQDKQMTASEHGKDKRMGKMRGMGCPCMMSMGKQMVATSDGGVVVLSGNKLYKYDKELNLKKEVEIKKDKEMMGKCPMMGGMMGGMRGDKPEGADEGEAMPPMEGEGN